MSADNVWILVLGAAMVAGFIIAGWPFWPRRKKKTPKLRECYECNSTGYWENKRQVLKYSGIYNYWYCPDCWLARQIAEIDANRKKQQAAKAKQAKVRAKNEAWIAANGKPE